LRSLPNKSIAPERIQSSAVDAGRREIQFEAKSHALVDPSRMEELKQLNADKFDFSKLIRMCEELNVSFATECHFAVSMLTRAILDHVPPIFGWDDQARRDEKAKADGYHLDQKRSDARHLRTGRRPLQDL